MHLVKIPNRYIGSFIHITSLEELQKRWLESKYIILQPPNKYGLELRLKDDIDEGYVSAISRHELIRLVTLKLIPSDTEVYMDYQFGNLHMYIYLEDINKDVLKTKSVYYYIDPKDNLITRAQLGPFIEPNALYSYNHLSGKTTTVEKVLKHKKINMFNIVSIVDAPFMCDDLF